MGLLSWITGPVGGIIGGIASGLLNNKGAEDRQEDAQSFSAAQYASRYQTTVKDMEAAGLNPGLAYGGISGSPPTSSAASSAGFPDLGSAANEGARSKAAVDLASAQEANINADTANKDAQRRLLEAQAAAAYGSADQSYANVRLIGENVRKIMAEVPNIQDQNANIREQGRVLRATAEMLGAQKSLMEQQGMSQEMIRANLAAQINKLTIESALSQFDLDAAIKFEGMGADAKQLGPIFDLIKIIVGSGLRRK